MFSCAKHTRNWAIFRQGVQVEEMHNAECKMQNIEMWHVFYAWAICDRPSKQLEVDWGYDFPPLLLLVSPAI